MLIFALLLIAIYRDILLKNVIKYQVKKRFCPLLTSLMSGSPILQNGKFVGAVTHVLLNDPTKGYGIFLETMLKAAN